MVSQKDYLDEMLDPLAACLTTDVARRIANLESDERMQAKLESWAEKSTAGELNEEERAEYELFVQAADIIAILQSKARRMLASTNGR